MKISFLRRVMVGIVVLCLTAVAVPVIPVLAAVGSFSLSITSGAVGSSVVLNGTSFTPSSHYAVYFASTAILTGTVTAGGAISGATFYVPEISSGTKNVTVTTDGPDTSNTLTFTVTNSVVLSASTGNVGDTITVTGHGFGASLTSSVYFDSTVVTTAGNTTTGYFTAAITIPAAIAGIHTIKGSDSGGTSPTFNYTILPELALSPITQAVGSPVSISGTGYKASSAVSFYIDGTLISGTTATTGTTGGFTLNNFVIPALTGGSHTITATDNGSNSSYGTLTVTPVISLNSIKGAAGSAITVSGSGFGANKTITITYGGSSIATSPANISTDTKGSFTANFVIPSGTATSYTVTASDSSLSASTSFMLSGSATINPTSGIGGTGVTINGVNFALGTTITVRFDNAQVGTAKADNLGAFSFSFKIPVAFGGTHTVSCTNGVDTVNITFVVTASVSISQNTGNVGSDINITGTGFAASGKVTISYDSKSIMTANTDVNGTFAISLKIPASATGNHTIITSDGNNTASTLFNVTAAGNLSTSNGNIGDEITVKGSGFDAVRQCAVLWDNAQVAVVNTDATGSVSLSFKVPSATRGSHTITISEGSNTVKQQVSIASSVKISPDSGNVGSSVTLTGTGFAAGKEITVKYDDIQVATSTTDASGSFTANFKAPVSIGGNHQVSITDQQGTVIAGFAMDSTAPAQPKPVLPADNTKAAASTVFSWSEVTDPSGVTYSLQVASDASFGNILVNKSGLPSPGYTLSKTESLKSVSKKEPYYWRVKAIDAASNESAWSAPQSFYVGIVFPTFAIYAIFGVALVLVFLIGFALGRRSGY